MENTPHLLTGDRIKHPIKSLYKLNIPGIMNEQFCMKSISDYPRFPLQIILKQKWQ